MTGHVKCVNATIRARFSEFSEHARCGESGSSTFPVDGYRIFMRSVPPHPYPLPKERGNLRRPHQIAAALPWFWATWLPLLGERVGVRGNLIDARTESQQCKIFSHPPKLSRNPFSFPFQQPFSG